MKCPNCGAESTGRFCSYCGSELPKKEPSIHIEHKETIINNYNKENPKTYGSIYAEEQMREQAREEIARKKAYERQRQQSKNLLISCLIIAGVFLFIWYKVSSWWNGLFDDGVDPIVVGSSEYNSVIDIDDNSDFVNNVLDNDEEKWYRITCVVDHNSDHNINSIKYGKDEKYFWIEMEDGLGLPEMEGQTVTFVGYLDFYDSYHFVFTHCIIE